MRFFLPSVSALAVLAASCGHAATGEKAAVAPSSDVDFNVEQLADFDQPWAMAFDEGTGTLLVTERKGQLRWRTPDGRMGTVSGIPDVDYGGQGGLGDVVFAPGQSGTRFDRRTIYLSWAEAGEGDTRGAAVGRGDLVCSTQMDCALEDLTVIWRQTPKVSGQGHYSHRMAFSPDGQYLFIASGDRQKMEPAQDLSNTLGTIVRLLPDGAPAPGNPFADKPAPTNEIWSYGHRNILGLAFDPDGRLWGLEHGPAGGDELNLIEPGRNYGWPLVANGKHYDGRAIPAHSTRPDLAGPAISWNPVIAPGGFIVYTGDAFPAWKGQVLITGLGSQGLVRARIDGASAREEARYPLGNRIREIKQAPDGSLWVLEDGKDADAGRLLKLTPRKQ